MYTPGDVGEGMRNTFRYVEWEIFIYVVRVYRGCKDVKYIVHKDVKLGKQTYVLCTWRPYEGLPGPAPTSTTGST